MIFGQKWKLWIHRRYLLVDSMLILVGKVNTVTTFIHCSTTELELCHSFWKKDSQSHSVNPSTVLSLSLSTQSDMETTCNLFHLVSRHPPYPCFPSRNPSLICPPPMLLYCRNATYLILFAVALESIQTFCYTHTLFLFKYKFNMASIYTQ